jgi:dihydrofolate reductase
MRKVTYGAACSLDGYIAGADGSLDWLRWSEDVSRLTSGYWTNVDTVVMGRKTYDAARAQGGGAYPGVTNYVFSRTLTNVPEDVKLVRGDAEDFVRALKAAEGGEICVMGGGELAETLFAAGLIDEVGANIHPIVLGSGVPLFQPLESRVQLELLRCEPIAHGCVYVIYRVVHQPR